MHQDKKVSLNLALLFLFAVSYSSLSYGSLWHYVQQICVDLSPYEDTLMRYGYQQEKLCLGDACCSLFLWGVIPCVVFLATVQDEKEYREDQEECINKILFLQ